MTAWDILAIVLPFVGGLLCWFCWWAFHETENESKKGIYSCLAIVSALGLLISVDNLFYRNWGPEPVQVTREEICERYPQVCVPPKVDVAGIIRENTP